MLYYKTIEPDTLDILKKIQSITEFSKLRLVGGTALALQIGHRKSIDLDFFGLIENDFITFSRELEKAGKITVLKNSTNINIFSVNNIKVDFVNYHYTWLEKAITEDDLLLAGIKDIAAMKIAAITGRGTKKDFIDLYFLLKRYNLKEILDFYMQKYPEGSIFLVLRSLAYFKDADEDEQPDMLIPTDWNEVKIFIENTLTDYIKNK